MRTGGFNFLEQDRVHFGTPAAQGLRTEADLRGAQRIVVVTSRSLNRHASAVPQALAEIQPRVVALFDQCVEHTPRASVMALATLLREARADLVVSIGGGTVIDTVKVALVALAEGLTQPEQLDHWHMRVAPDGSRVVPQPRTPPCRQIAVPTTLSGAEFSDLGGCTDERHGTKQGYTGAFIGAAAVILDPRITVHTPERLWLSTGVRAVDHAVEALCSVNAQPLIDATSVRALTLMARSLRRYVQASDDLDARLDGQLAAWLAATSIRRTEYGASHGLGHALGADAGVPHGITSCVLLPTVMRFNAAACGPQLAEVAAALGDAHTPAADQIEALIASLGLPTRIGQLGIDRARLPVIAEKALANPWVRSNPQPLTDVAGVLGVLESA
ncbi:MAG: alcohol dehydrogenase, partial [Burkholderiales bacterium PBB4]